MEWFKFYHNKWLTDRAINNLCPQDRLCFITLLCVTSQSDARDGCVTHYSEHEIIKLTQLDVNVTDDTESDYHRAIGFTQRLVDCGIIEMINTATIRIKNFEKRQDTMLSPAERSKKYRDKKRVTTVTKKSDERTARVDKSRVEEIRKEYSEQVLGLTNLLISLISQNTPDWKMKGSIYSWAENIEKMHRIDGRPYEQIETMIRWTQSDPFWKQNILSTAKLREKFNDLIPKLKGAVVKQHQEKIISNKPKMV